MSFSLLCMKSNIYIYINLYLSFIYLNLDLAVEVFIIHINKDTFSPKMNSVSILLLMLNLGLLVQFRCSVVSDSL